jgi:phosphoribosylanthranilate isomerase
MFIKICGITNIEDALLAADAGANALGFIFAQSKRQISAEIAAGIIPNLPSDIEKIGVFVNAERDVIMDTARIAGITGIQLSGDESPALCDELSRRFKVLKSVKIDPGGDILTKENYPVWKLLLDTYIPNTSGGTGKTFNWNCLDKFDRNQIIVAGGLNPENIGTLLSQFQPFGIDVSSGLEARPGKKAPAKVRRFFEVIHQFGN